MSSRRAFTLIELLTVIAIIAILAAILFPVFAKAREKGNETSCLSNEKQITLGFIMYAQDYDQRLPQLWAGPPGAGQLGGWTYYSIFCGTQSGNFDPSQGSVFPDIKNAQIFQCPDDDVDAGDSYAVNQALSSQPPGYGLHAGMSITRIKRPANTLLLLEEANPASAGTTNDGYFDLVDVCAYRHLDDTVVSFCDGHVKAVGPGVISGAWTKGAAASFDPTQ